MDEIKSLLQSIQTNLNQRLDIIDNRLTTVDSRLTTIDTRLASIEQRLGRIEKCVSHENADFQIS